jgi:hypothetical protein
MIEQISNEQLNLFIITSVLLIEENDENEPTWPKELYAKKELRNMLEKINMESLYRQF